MISSDQAPVAWSPILSAEVARIATFFPLMIMWHVWIACVSGGVGCAGVRRSGRGGEVHARFILPLFRLQTQSAAVADSFELNLFLSNLPRYRKERTKHHNSTLRPNLHTALHALAALRPHPQPPLPSTRNCTALTAAAPPRDRTARTAAALYRFATSMDPEAILKRRDALGLLLADATKPQPPASGRCTNVMVCRLHFCP